LARHFGQAGLTDAAIEWWGKAGQRSLERSAALEAVEQFTRALGQIATLPAAPALRREQIQLQVGLAVALRHTKGYAAPETKASLDQALSLIDRGKALGEPLEDPLLLFSVLHGLWTVSLIAFNGDAARELATQFLALAEQQGDTVPLTHGHRLLGLSLLFAGDILEARAHCDRAIALYDPMKHRPLVTTFGVDAGVTALCYRSEALWLLGYPAAALTDAGRALADAREIGHATTLMNAQLFSSSTYVLCGDYAAANAQLDQLVALADKQGALHWHAEGMAHQGVLLTLTGKASDAMQMITSGIAALRSIGTTVQMPRWLSYLARAHVGLGQSDDAWRCIAEAMTSAETTKEKWYEADIHRTVGEIALASPERDATKAEAYFERALAVARDQHAKSWELRAAMSMARLWRDQGKRQQARDLLAPVYGWFTEGFDTLDLKQAKALLDELA
jgi:predicted ATPase